MLDSATPSLIKDYHSAEVERLRKAYEEGVIVAVPAALHYCSENKIAPPPWVVEAALILLCDLLKRTKAKELGRANSPIARYCQNKIDFMRWDQVVSLREEQQRSIESIRDYPPCNSPLEREMYARESAKAEWLGHTLTRLFDCASEALVGTEAFAGREAIKKSYLAVDRYNRESVAPFKYCLFDPKLARLLGFGSLGDGFSTRSAPWQRNRVQHRRRPRLSRKRSA